MHRDIVDLDLERSKPEGNSRDRNVFHYPLHNNQMLVIGPRFVFQNSFQVIFVIEIKNNLLSPISLILNSFWVHHRGLKVCATNYMFTILLVGNFAAKRIRGESDSLEHFTPDSSSSSSFRLRQSPLQSLHQG